jgi:oligoendopeptidase F
MSFQPEELFSKIERPSNEFPRRFVPVNLDLSDWDQIEPLFRELVDRRLDRPEDLEQWIYDQDELDAALGEEGTRCRIATACDTSDKDAEKLYLHYIQEILPKMQPYGHELNLRLLACPHFRDLDPNYYEMLLKTTRNAVELFREENIQLGVQVTRLNQEYQKIAGGITVTYAGREYTTSQLSVFASNPDRKIRENVFRLLTEERLKYVEKIDDIYNRMLDLRLRIARNAGFDNFRDYQFRFNNRFDYTSDDCFKFHDAIKNTVVPLTCDLLEERRSRMKLNSVCPFDIGCDEYGRGSLRPFEDARQLLQGCQTIFSRLDRELGNKFQQMIDLDLLDLESRKGKAPGGSQWSLTEVRYPFIFMHAVGTNDNLFTLLHEAGHAFHNFAARREPLLAYRRGPREFNEVASMTMEMIGSDYLDVFYSLPDAARARRQHLENAVWSLKGVAGIDAFQHWVYTHPGHTSEERSDYWLSLSHRFSSGIDWSDYEAALRAGWQMVHHIFNAPFYYIEYGIARLGSLQIWRNFREAPARALEAYKAALKLGGSRPLPELFETAGARFDFSAEILEPLMEMLFGEIDRLGKLESSTL